MTEVGWNKKWRGLRNRCKFHGTPFSLTLDEYIQLAKEAGLSSPDQIGRSIDSYHMGRLGDTGGYHLGNCRFITHSQNQDERVENGRTSKGKTLSDDVGVLRMSITKRGRTKDTHDYIKSQSAKLSGRTKEDYEYIMEHSKKVSKSFKLVSPDGEVHEGTNLYQFSKKHGLTNSLISMVCAGKKSQYKGWKGSYV